MTKFFDQIFNNLNHFSMYWIQLFFLSGGIFWLLTIAFILLWIVEDTAPSIDDDAWMADDNDPDFWND